MSEYKLEYTLKQDSPMIHFQGSTKGATLRASEVKPKLDRFLTEWCERKRITAREEKGEEAAREWEIEKAWKVDEEHDAYDYKMRIYASGKQYPVRNRLPSYFGDLNADEARRNVWYANGIKLEILCFYKRLREIINDAIETFFVLHNFGTRQNRGIGGFTLRKTTCQRAEELLTDWYKVNKIQVYKMVFQQGTDAVKILKSGNMFYQILKSGINDRGTYIKSYLTIYFLNRIPRGTTAPQLIGGEKRWMKQNGIAPAIRKTWREPNNQINVNDRYRYIRGLLGTSGELRYQDGHGGWETIKITSKELERVPSSIRYKLVENVLFLIPLIPGKDIYSKGKTVCGKRFHFKNPNRNTSGDLDIPKQNEEFVMRELIDKYIDYLRNDVYDDVVQYTKLRGILPRPIEEQPSRRWIQRCRGGNA